MLDLAIIGGGPAGLSAGLYATRGGLANVVLYEKFMPGGQITSSSELENYPGVATVMDGISFMAPWSEQACRFGLKIEQKEVKRVEKNADAFDIIFQDESKTTAKAVIVCTGAAPKKAGFKGEQEFFGRGVSTCATCDGAFYRKKEVAVLGGGDTALEEALYLANLCSKVYLIHRREGFRAAPSTVKRAKDNEKIEFILNAQVEEVLGDNSGVTAVNIVYKDGSKKRLEVPGIFTFVGLDVKNDVLKQNDGSFICEMIGDSVKVDLKMRTNVPGLFVAGDIRQDAPRQVVCAAADGATAALSAISYIEESH